MQIVQIKRAASQPPSKLILSRAPRFGHSRYDRHLPMLLARGPHGNLDILSKGSKELHEAFDRKGSRTVAHEGRDVWLLNVQDFSGLGLLQASRLKEPVNL